MKEKRPSMLRNSARATKEIQGGGGRTAVLCYGGGGKR